MQATAVVREAWELYKVHWRTFVPIAFVVYLILGVVTLVLALILGPVGVILGALAGIVGIFWLQGAIVEAVRDVRDGRQDLSLGETFSRVRPRLTAIIAAGLVAGLAIAGVFIVVVVLGLIAPIFFVLLVGSVVAAFYLFTIWCLIVPAIVLEGKSAGESFGRSRDLVRGNGWNVFGVIVIVIAASIVANIIVSIALFWLPDAAQGFLQSLVSNTIVAPFMAVALTLTYYALSKPIEGVGTSVPAAPQPPPPE